MCHFENFNLKANENNTSKDLIIIENQITISRDDHLSKASTIEGINTSQRFAHQYIYISIPVKWFYVL